MSYPYKSRLEAGPYHSEKRNANPFLHPTSFLHRVVHSLDWKRIGILRGTGDLDDKGDWDAIQICWGLIDKIAAERIEILVGDSPL